MEKFLDNTPVPWVKVTDPSTGKVYYSTATHEYADRNGPDPTFLQNVIIEPTGSGATDTGSLLTSASFRDPDLTFTKGDGSTFNVNISTLTALSASYAVSASYAPTGSPFPYTGSARITGSLNVIGTTTITGSILITGSGTINNCLIITSCSTGSFYTTGSFGFYGAFCSTASQTNPVRNISRSMNLETTEHSNGVRIESGSKITVVNPGTYNLQFSAQLEKTTNGTDTIYIWFKKNGNNVARSATSIDILKQAGGGGRQVAAWNYIDTYNAGDYIEIVWQSNDTNIILAYDTASGNYPEIPSVIATLNQIA